MIDCKHADKKGRSESAIKCLKLCEACGFTASVDAKFCLMCDARAPLTEPGQGKPPLETTLFLMLYKQSLRSRIVAGDLPRWHRLEAFDANGLMTKYIAIATPGEPEKLFREAFHHQVQFTEKEGGHPPEVLAEKFSALSKAQGLETTWNEVLSEYAVA